MKISLICRNSHPQVFYQVGVLKNFAQFTGRYQCWSLFLNELQDGGLKPATLLKKDSSTGGSFQNFEEYFFCRTAVDDCFWIYQNINCQKVSVSELIISKCYKEAGRRGGSKLLLSTNINYQKCYLTNSTWFYTEYLYLYSPKLSFKI